MLLLTQSKHRQYPSKLRLLGPYGFLHIWQSWNYISMTSALFLLFVTEKINDRSYDWAATQIKWQLCMKIKKACLSSTKWFTSHISRRPLECCSWLTPKCFRTPIQTYLSLQNIPTFEHWIKQINKKKDTFCSPHIILSPYTEPRLRQKWKTNTNLERERWHLKWLFQNSKVVFLVIVAW